MKIIISVLIFFICLVGVFLPTCVFAHRVILFAWVEDGMVHIEGGFGSDKPAQNCEIKAFDVNKALIFSGKTTTAGSLSFKVPGGHASDMMIELNAGPGHKGTWTIRAQEFTATVPPVKPVDSPQHQALENGANPVRILVGIGLIFALALGAGLLRKKAKGLSND